MVLTFLHMGFLHGLLSVGTPSPQLCQDVFDYNMWQSNRSSKRLFTNLVTLTSSRVVRGTWKEVAAVVGVMVAVLLYNDGLSSLVDLYPPLASRPIISVPMYPFTLTSSFLSLLLVFRTNTAYQRWLEARMVWGSTTNTCRDLTRQLSWRTSVPASEKLRIVQRIAAFPRTLRAHCGSDMVAGQLQDELERLLEPEDVSFILGCKHRPMAVLGAHPTSAAPAAPA
jgi:ion channel-forming bestrophin family protein